MPPPVRGRLRGRPSGATDAGPAAMAGAGAASGAAGGGGGGGTPSGSPHAQLCAAVLDSARAAQHPRASPRRAARVGDAPARVPRLAHPTGHPRRCSCRRPPLLRLPPLPPPWSPPSRGGVPPDGRRALAPPPPLLCSFRSAFLPPHAAPRIHLPPLPPSSSAAFSPSFSSLRTGGRGGWPWRRWYAVGGSPATLFLPARAAAAVGRGGGGA